MVRAYYSVLLELILGLLLTEGEREVIFEGFPMYEFGKRMLCANIIAGHCLFGTLTLPGDVVDVVREWQRLSWFS
ncbi:MAG: hypothetical protein ACKPKO_29810, partial [Candidatus Fonsibacter sp.]